MPWNVRKRNGGSDQPDSSWKEGALYLRHRTLPYPGSYFRKRLSHFFRMASRFFACQAKSMG